VCVKNEAGEKGNIKRKKLISMKNKINAITKVLALFALVAFVATAHADKGSGSNKGPNTNNVPGMNRGPNTNNMPSPNQGHDTNDVPNVNNNTNDTVEIALVAGPGFKGAKGIAEFRSRVGHQEFEVEVQVSKTLAGLILNVSVDTMIVGTITVDSSGHGELELEAEHGTTVPAVQLGSLVGVTDAADDIILAGQF
jgi:hypothetical protein